MVLAPVLDTNHEGRPAIISPTVWNINCLNCMIPWPIAMICFFNFMVIVGNLMAVWNSRKLLYFVDLSNRVAFLKNNFFQVIFICCCNFCNFYLCRFICNILFFNTLFSIVEKWKFYFQYFTFCFLLDFLHDSISIPRPIKLVLF